MASMLSQGQGLTVAETVRAELLGWPLALGIPASKLALAARNDVDLHIITRYYATTVHAGMTLLSYDSKEGWIFGSRSQARAKRKSGFSAPQLRHKHCHSLACQTVQPG